MQKGHFAARTLQSWANCSSYVLVDAWRNLPNYHDVANHDDAMQDSIMHEALESVAPWSDRIVVCRNFTSSCAPVFPDASFDFVYVDARHDYIGVTEDLMLWWPKAKEGALFCGHDFVTQEEGPAQSGQRWDINVREGRMRVRRALALTSPLPPPTRAGRWFGGPFGQGCAGRGRRFRRAQGATNPGGV